MQQSLISNIVFEDIDHRDSPDYCDAYISSADYDGVPMTSEQIDELNDDADMQHELLIDYLN